MKWFRSQGNVPLTMIPLRWYQSMKSISSRLRSPPMYIYNIWTNHFSVLYPLVRWQSSQYNPLSIEVCPFGIPINQLNQLNTNQMMISTVFLDEFVSKKWFWSIDHLNSKNQSKIKYFYNQSINQSKPNIIITIQLKERLYQCE